MAQPSRLIRDLGAWALNRTLGVISRQQANEQMTVNRESVVITPHPGSPSRIGLAATSPPSPSAQKQTTFLYGEQTKWVSGADVASHFPVFLASSKIHFNIFVLPALYSSRVARKYFAVGFTLCRAISSLRVSVKSKVLMFKNSLCNLLTLLAFGEILFNNFPLNIQREISNTYAQFTICISFALSV